MSIQKILHGQIGAKTTAKVFLDLQRQKGAKTTAEVFLDLLAECANKDGRNTSGITWPQEMGGGRGGRMNIAI